MDQWRDLGGIEARTLLVSRFKLDGGSMYAELPKPYWSRFSKADELNRIPLVVRALLLRTSETTILIEAGMGNDFTPVQTRRLAIDDLEGGLERALEEAGVRPESIDHLILTHLHFDHVAGLGRPDEAGIVNPVLPNATVYIQRSHWEKAGRPGPKEIDSFQQRDLDLIAKMKTVFLDGAAEILPGIELALSDGHTTGLQVVTIRGEQETLYYPSDMIPTLAHVRVPYTMGFDMWPEKLVSEKEAYLSEVARTGGIMVFIHDPLTAACRVGKGPRGYSIRGKEII
jgi:glyoxylase-like metal-dependent hydrolase (beta-lactamase superfamily II)